MVSQFKAKKQETGEGISDKDASKLAESAQETVENIDKSNLMISDEQDDIKLQTNSSEKIETSAETKKLLDEADKILNNNTQSKSANVSKPAAPEPFSLDIQSVNKNDNIEDLKIIQHDPMTIFNASNSLQQIQAYNVTVNMILTRQAGGNKTDDSSLIQIERSHHGRDSVDEEFNSIQEQDMQQERFTDQRVQNVMNVQRQHYADDLERSINQ